ncbi:hypothetical protein Hypma_012307 [Hypsizygus marmoreus]|uniref:Uncharacterized protein n=1 Tax=Hypsizygus marmoreus TaxID=39966 RepID=A0A369JPK6_HYPMA|nr:hypothetical protein Hypma_012307 [Hypsizygus marmoreus]
MLLPPVKPECVRPPLPPLTLSDIGPSPPLRNRDPSKRPIVKTYFLGFVVTFEDLAQWGADHDLVPGGEYYRLRNEAWDTLRMVVPHPTATATVRYGPDRMYGSSFVVATNRTPGELERAGDLEFIEQVRTILGKEEPPIWHRRIIAFIHWVSWRAWVVHSSLQLDHLPPCTNPEHVTNARTRVKVRALASHSRGPFQRLSTMNNYNRLPLPPLRPGLVRQPHPPLTLEDIEPGPGLRNIEPLNGRVVKLHALCFIMTYSELEEWGRDHDIVLTSEYDLMHRVAWSTICKALPHPAMVATVRYGKKHSLYSLAVVVATNRTPGEMARATDLEYMEQVRSILGTEKKPVWGRPLGPW